jgi:hypothetical protein
VILVGGEINAEIEHASASGKAPGEKVEGAGPTEPGVESSEVKEQLEEGRRRYRRRVPRRRSDEKPRVGV